MAQLPPSLATLEFRGTRYRYHTPNALAGEYDLARLPFSIRILLENALRHAGEPFVSEEDIRALAGWDPRKVPEAEIAFVPARVLLQDFTGVPAVVDLAAMREPWPSWAATQAASIPSPRRPGHRPLRAGGRFGTDGRLRLQRRGGQRNRERYQFLKWGQQGLRQLRRWCRPAPASVHQVNLEYLARCVLTERPDGPFVYPDTLVGTDSHTTMINGLGHLGWGVGGIEAEAGMLGQPDLHADPRGGGRALYRRAAEGSRPPTSSSPSPSSCASTGWWASSSSSSAPGSQPSRWPTGPPSPTWPRNTGPPAASSRWTTKTLDYLRLTGRDEHQVDRGGLRKAGALPQPTAGPEPGTARCWSSTSPRWSPPWRAQAAPGPDRPARVRPEASATPSPEVRADLPERAERRRAPGEGGPTRRWAARAAAGAVVNLTRARTFGSPTGPW
ncbi:MAG: hypothetical protein KatS3mg124_0799 [Porticoccaceae bacterium]|nr:MAG: hypothetical protein KatS3mg124_0799 [Porticoccaceae bacterium]